MPLMLLKPRPGRFASALADQCRRQKPPSQGCQSSKLSEMVTFSAREWRKVLVNALCAMEKRSSLVMVVSDGFVPSYYDLGGYGCDGCEAGGVGFEVRVRGFALRRWVRLLWGVARSHMIDLDRSCVASSLAIKFFSDFLRRIGFLRALWRSRDRVRRRRRTGRWCRGVAWNSLCVLDEVTVHARRIPFF